MNKSETTLIFLHIPKAAGSTLARIIRQQYNHGKVLDTYPGKFREQCAGMSALERARFRYNYVKSMPESDLRSVSAFLGHEGIGFHELFPQPTTYITMLRDPVDRVLSYYYYVHQSPHHRMYGKVVENEMSLEDFIGNSADNSELDNSQTKYLAGLETPCLHQGEYGDELLDKAKQNIEQYFTAVGLTERFNESLILFKRRLGWSMPYYIRANVTQKRLGHQEIPETILRMIQEKNALDMALYEYITERFQADIDAEGSSFAKEVRMFNFGNRVYTALHTPYRAVRAKVNQ